MKQDIIKLINDKQRYLRGSRYELHFDLYLMREESLHIILFELLILRKMQVGLRDFASIPLDVTVYIEVANTFNNQLLKSLAYL